MTGPEDPAAAGRDRLRAGHADREQVIKTLKDAFVHGRLTRDELDVQAGRALVARTRAEMAALTADIPAGPAVAGRRVRRHRYAADRCLGDRRVGRLSGHRFRCRVGRRQHPRSEWPRQPPSSLESPVPFVAVFAVVTALGIMINGVGTAVEQRRSRRQLPPGQIGQPAP